MTQTVDPKLYQPVGNWVGRLILPKQEIKLNSNSDWVWFEVQQAPPQAKNLIGKIVRLEWKNQPQLKAYVKAVTRDVNFTPATFKSHKGNIHPDRLNNRSQVKPLQSLAGARPNDDVIVTLDDAEVIQTNDVQILQIDREPVLATGRFYGLVDIESNNKELFQVRHYNPDSDDFNGDRETIYIPQQVVDTRNIPPSTTNKLAESTVNQAWYIYVAKNKQGIFTVQALAPRSLFQLQPDAVITNPDAQNYLKNYWDITPATSCIQDSSQALYAAIAITKRQIKSNPKIQNWLQNHPNHPQTLRFQQLNTLSKELERYLLPLGIVRSDWESSVDILAGIGDTKEPFVDSSIWAALTSWRTMMPRQAQDELATLFGKQKAKLWFLQTYQVGGWNPEITPLAPTPLLGQIKLPFTNVPIISILLDRILASLTIPTLHDWLIASLAILTYTTIALPLGFSTGFLQLQIWAAKPIEYFFLILRCLITPAITEELFFRVLFLPHPSEAVNWQWSIWAALSLLIFIIYHPLNAKTLYKDGYPTFFQPIFLILATLLGITCTITYAIAPSAWIIIFIHWLVVVLWLAYFGGMSKLSKQ